MSTFKVIINLFSILILLLPQIIMCQENNILTSSSSCDIKDSNSHEGYKRAREPYNNKGMGFTHEERAQFGLRGLYPGGVPLTLDQKVENAMSQLKLRKTDLDKYIYLHTIMDSDETLYYSILCRHTYETMPFVYTPTVGEACQKWGQIFRHSPRGLYISENDSGDVRTLLDSHPHDDVKVIVVTDGERILGLGDLGVDGMGIPIGKLALYTACAGINPRQCLPVHLDVGTNNEEKLASPHYMGIKHHRDQSKIDGLVAEFFRACQDKYGRNVLIQFEDFGNTNAFRLLEDHVNTATTFNDDIQGTASVVLAGLISSLSLANKSSVADHVYLFNGAGEAGVGIANLISMAIVLETGCTEEESRKNIWLVDSRGLITSARTDELAHHKIPYAHAPPSGSVTASGDTLLDATRLLKPTALIGVSAQGGSFTKEICEEMCIFNENPVIFALSNPTSKAECTAEQAYTYTNGKAIFASGSPFFPVTLPDGRHFVPGQGNNAYIFPGLGLGVISCNASQVTDEDMYVAAAALAAQVTPEQLAQGCAYPPLSNIRNVSLFIAAAVAENSFKKGRATVSPKEGQTWIELCAENVYVPSY